jgi:hypothetical protein
MLRRLPFLFFVAFLLLAQSASADTVTFTFTFDAMAAGIAGQSGNLTLFIRSNASTPPLATTFFNFSFSGGVLGSIITQSCSATGTITTQLGLSATDTTLSGPNLPSCVHDQAVVSFPNTLSIDVTATFPSGLPIELELAIGNSANFFVGAAIVYVNTDGNGSTTSGFNSIPGAVNVFTYPNFTATSSPVPEPATVLLFSTGLAGLWWKRRRI